MKPAVLLTALALLATLPACANPPVELAPRVEARYPHDPGAFTQGLLLADGMLYESTGLYGRSSLREVDPGSGEVIRVRHLDDRYFGEGLALVEDRLIQLTWRSGRAFVYRLDTFEQLDVFDYQGEGWGLCYDGEELWMSDGSASLTVRDENDFEVLRRVEVTRAGEPVALLNELECVGDQIFANVWQTDLIVRIDKGSGRVDGVIDASGLLGPAELAALPADGVLNGIAYDPEADRFLLTGKLWPKLFSVRFE